MKIKDLLEKKEIFFNIFAQNIYCGCTFKPNRRGVSNEYTQSMFWINNKKNTFSLLDKSKGIRGYTFQGHAFLM